MNKKILLIMAVIVLTIVIASVVTAFVFNTSFAHSTIDYISFLIAFFLIAEGFYKIKHYREELYFPNQLMRHVRIVIGTCIFTIHIMQYVYGV